VRAVLDTNVIVSRALSPTGTPAAIVERWLQGEYTLLVSDVILDEYRQTLALPRIQQRARISSDAISKFIDDVVSTASFVQPEQRIAGVSSDPDDDIFLECALAGGADYIVSGDRHLLSLETFHGIPIVSPSLFAAILDQPDEL
jgi:uncharacterized protein